MHSATKEKARYIIFMNYWRRPASQIWFREMQIKNFDIDPGTKVAQHSQIGSDTWLHPVSKLATCSPHPSSPTVVKEHFCLGHNPPVRGGSTQQNSQNWTKIPIGLLTAVHSAPLVPCLTGHRNRKGVQKTYIPVHMKDRQRFLYYYYYNSYNSLKHTLLASFIRKIATRATRVTSHIGNVSNIAH